MGWGRVYRSGDGCWMRYRRWPSHEISYEGWDLFFSDDCGWEHGRENDEEPGKNSKAK
jgi:hypothetical protein